MGKLSGSLLAAALLAGAALGAQPQGETQLMASTIGLLADYVTWPQEHRDAPFVIGVYGTSPIGDRLRAAAGTRTVRGRAVQVVNFRNLYGLDRVDILYICGAEAELLPEILKQVRGKAVLTVSDLEGTGEAGVMVNLLLDKGKLAFEVNLPAVRRGGLVLSARVLRLARIIEAK